MKYLKDNFIQERISINLSIRYFNNTILNKYLLHLLIGACTILKTCTGLFRIAVIAALTD